MGSLLSSKTKTSQTNSVAVPKEYQAALDDLMGKFKSAAEIPFQEYQGKRVEDLSGREQTAFSRIDGMQDKYNPLMQLAMSQAMEAGDGYGPEDVDKFINPYTQYVINNSKERFQEDYEKRLLGARGDAARSGSFGNSRLGLVEGTLGSEFLKGSRELQYGGLRDAFDRAMPNILGFNQDKRQGLASILNTVQQGQNIDYRNIDALAGAGRQERAIGQAGKDFDAQEFLRRIQDPQQKTAFLAQGVYNYPRELFTRNSNSTTTQTMSPVQAAIGIGSVAASFANPLSGLSGLFSNPTAGAASGPPMALMPQMQQPIYGLGYGGQGAYGGNIGSPYGFKKGGLIRGYKKGGLVKRYASGGYLDRLAGKESGGRDDIKASTSSATGRFQFIDSTWNQLAKSPEGKKLGLRIISGKDDPRKDPEQSFKAIELLNNQNRAALEAAGFEPSEKNMYMAHFMGSDGAIKFLNKLEKNPDAKAAKLFPREAKANRNVFKNRTLKEMYDWHTRNFKDAPVTSFAGLKNLGKGVQDGFNNLLLALNSEKSESPTGQEISNPIYADAGEMRSEGFDKTLPTGFNRDNLQNAQFAVDLEGLMEQDIPAELLDDSATASLTDLGRKRQLLNLAQRSREDDRLTKEATRAYDILDSGDYAAEEEGFLKRMTRAPFVNKQPLPEPPKFYKDINLEKYAQNPLVALLEENPSVMGNILYNLRERPKQDEKIDGYAEGGLIDLVRQNAIPDHTLTYPRPEKVWPESLPMQVTPANVNFLKQFMAGASNSAPAAPTSNSFGDMSTGGFDIQEQPKPSKHEKTVDLSIQNLMKMAGVEPPKEEEKDTILGLGYDKDLMRFGLALLAAGPGKAGAQAIGEAGQVLLAGKESDKAKKRAREQEYLKELNAKLGIMTQGANLRNLDPDTQMANLERRLQLQSDAAIKLAQTKASLKTKSEKERVELIKAMINSGDPMGQKLAKEFLGVQEQVDPEQGIEDIE